MTHQEFRKSIRECNKVFTYIHPYVENLYHEGNRVELNKKQLLFIFQGRWPDDIFAYEVRCWNNKTNDFYVKNKFDLYIGNKDARFFKDDSLSSRLREATRKAELTKAKDIAKKALMLASRGVCAHEDTYRGGAIWIICHDCEMKWADDEGGFKPNPALTEIEKLFKDLDSI